MEQSEFIVQLLTKVGGLAANKDVIVVDYLAQR